MMSGWTPPTRMSSMTVSWTTTKSSTTRVRRPSSLRFTRLGPHSTTRHVAEVGEVGQGLQTHALLGRGGAGVGGDDPGHRDPGREERALEPARGEDLAVGQRRVVRDEVGTQRLARTGAVQHGQRARRRAVADAHRRLPVGDEPDGGGVVAHLHDLAHQAAVADHRHVELHAVGCAPRRCRWWRRSHWSRSR